MEPLPRDDNLRQAPSSSVLQIAEEWNVLFEAYQKQTARYIKRRNILNTLVAVFGSLTLVSSRNKALVVALLRALQQIGDEQDLPTVRALLNGSGSLSKDVDVRTMALECALFLKHDAKRNLVGQTLLCASDQPSAPAELLRPVISTETVDPQQLLRPSADQMT